MLAARAARTGQPHLNGPFTRPPVQFMIVFVEAPRRSSSWSTSAIARVFARALPPVLEWQFFARFRKSFALRRS